MTRTVAHACAARRIWSCVALALCCLCLGGARGVAGFTLDNAVAQSTAGLHAVYTAACPYFGCVSASPSADSDVSDQEEAVPDDTPDAFPTEMPLVLPGEDDVRSYPAFPHSPLLVVAGTCQAVVLRWRSFEDLVWPVSRFILQRFPDSQHRPQWTTVLDGNASDLVDLEVRTGQRYAYRIQALSKRNASSAFAYHWTTVQDVRNGSAGSICGSSGALATSLNSDGARSLGLIFACFLTVYGLMRASVKSVQGTQSRNSRLKRISKSTSEVTSPRLRPSTSGEALPANFAARRSSTSTSTSISSQQSASVEQSSRSSGGSAVLDSNLVSTAATAGRGTRHSMMDWRQDSAVALQPRPASRSIGGVGEKAETCNHCHKRFGLFRRRYVCDICHSVTLCRKCGFQASVDSFAASRASPEGGDRRRGRRRSSVSQQHQKKLKIRTICRACCDDMYRYSTHPSVRPSYVQPAHYSTSDTAVI